MTRPDGPHPGVAPHELVIDLWQTVGPILVDNLYLVLGTADAAGKPWVSPVFFAARDENLLYWVSSPDTRHSRNIDVRPTVAITVFDSRAAIGTGEAVYMTGTASALDATAGAAGLDTLNARLPAGQQLSSDDLGPRGPLAVYTAAVDDHYVLVRGGDPRFDTTSTRRTESPRRHGSTRETARSGTRRP